MRSIPQVALGTLRYDITQRMRAFLTSLLITLPAFSSLAAELTVTTADDAVDAGDGVLSLREAIADATSGDSIIFDLALDGETINTTAQLVLDKNLTIDATDLPAGIRIDAGGSHRALDVPGGVSVTIRGFSILNGITTAQNGGGIRCFGDTTIEECLFNGCQARFGGAVWAGNAAVVTATNCTFSGNGSAFAGNAIGGNQASVSTLDFCTIYQNNGIPTALPNFPGVTAGSYYAGAGTSITIGHCVIADNLNRDGNEQNGWFASGALFFSTGYNLSDQAAGPGNLPSDIPLTDPMLGPLQYWGGRSACHRPLPGSPLINAGDPALGASPKLDQLGAPRIHDGRVDIGPAEFGIATFEQWADHFGVTPDPDADDDEDGSTHLEEYSRGSDPDNGDETLLISSGIGSGSGLFEYVIPTALERTDFTVTIERSADLQIWSEAARLFPGGTTTGAEVGVSADPSGSPLTISELTAAGSANPRRFYRTKVHLSRPQ